MQPVVRSMYAQYDTAPSPQRPQPKSPHQKRTKRRERESLTNPYHNDYEFHALVAASPPEAAQPMQRRCSAAGWAPAAHPSVSPLRVQRLHDQKRGRPHKIDHRI